jgi:5-methylcytosine-specific restriction endonuclease McrA
VFARDGRVCQLRLEGCTGYALHVHHIRDWADGGDHSLDNLQAACAHCNVSERNRRIAAKAREARGLAAPKTYPERW